MARTRLQARQTETPLENVPEPLESESQEDVSLDQLFEDLAAETAEIKPREETLEQIQKDLDNLPKIESGLDNLDETEKIRGLIVKVNDPITHKVAKPKKGEETDSGSKWFNMKAQELTPEIKRDLLILKNRSVLDPKRHYKKENWEIPKFFQMGTIVEGNTEFYSARMSKKSRGRTIAEEILKDDKSTEYFDKKVKEIHSAEDRKKAYYQKLKAKKRGY